MAIIAVRRFYDTLVDVLSAYFCVYMANAVPNSRIGIIGYWSSVFAVIILTEHFVIRRGSFSSYNVGAWNSPRKLPPGLAALASFLCAFGIIIPSMSQVWYTGPIALKGTGDLGILLGSAVAFLLYFPLRTMEKRLFGR